MIYYFSATGNSRALAQALAKRLDDQAISIVDYDLASSSCQHSLDGVLGFVFPIYGWSLPNIVKDFILQLGQQLREQNCSPRYVYCAVTCGDEVGMADRHIRKVLKSAGLQLDACFSLQMPDCYICLPGFDVDPDQELQQKLADFPLRVEEIAQKIEQRQHVIDLKRGPLPYLMTYALGGLFRRFLVTDKPFHTTSSCTGCGQCQKVCPLHNITIHKSRPQWAGHCTACLACYHHCPNRSIRFGRFTETKGQYLLKQHLPQL